MDSHYAFDQQGRLAKIILPDQSEVGYFHNINDDYIIMRNYEMKMIIKYFVFSKKLTVLTLFCLSVICGLYGNPNEIQFKKGVRNKLRKIVEGEACVIQPNEFGPWTNAMKCSFKYRVALEELTDEVVAELDKYGWYSEYVPCETYANSKLRAKKFDELKKTEKILKEYKTDVVSKFSSLISEVEEIANRDFSSGASEYMRGFRKSADRELNSFLCGIDLNLQKIQQTKELIEMMSLCDLEGLYFVEDGCIYFEYEEQLDQYLMLSKMIDDTQQLIDQHDTESEIRFEEFLEKCSKI